MIAAKLSRRDTLGLLAGASAAIGLAPGVARAGQAKAHEDAGALSDAIARRLLEADPEMATSLGLDSGAQAHLRFRLRDRSPEGLVRLTAMLRADLARVEAIDAAILEPAQAISLAVIASAFRIALDGLALPYGDVAVGGWRNTPYVVIQNAGAYLDVPRFLEADHPLRNREDIDALLSRLAALPAVLRGEGERIRAARAIGVIPPGFLLDKAIAQMERSLADARESGTLVHGLARRIRETFGTVGNYEARAQAIVTGGILPALAEQLEELKHQRRLAHDAPGISARPHGDAYYAWALRAGTTTTLSPAEIHALGHEELATLHAQMEPILASIGYTSGTIGMRMAALADLG
ncbi:MAG: DUF885 family protein [Novosphingobium sp.]|nr:DUF885 family protein [Novosphingobium sp.]